MNIQLDLWTARKRTLRVTPLEMRPREARSLDEAGRLIREMNATFRRPPRPEGWYGPGWFGYFTYDYGERLLGIPPRGRTRALPLLRFAHAASVLRRQGSHDLILAANPAAFRRAKELAGDMRRPAEWEPHGLPELIRLSDSRERYTRKIKVIQAHLNDGNVYQVNLSRRWTWHFQDHADPARLYQTVGMKLQPRFGFLYADAPHAVLSFSPELFIGVEGRRIWAEPIKGTARPGERGELWNDKNRAELLMITDLFRNDFGRICVPGSITAKGPRQLDLNYAIHLYSRIEGTLRHDAGLPQILEAVFPSGSITGAPKISACRLIRELEPFARGPAYGCAGWIGPGRILLSVSIRTATMFRDTLEYTAGGGITVCSDPDAEFDETLVKSQAFARALSLPLESINLNRAAHPRRS